MPKLSVLLPVRNGQASLQRALDSLWQQSFHDFELVVVDDGSTDGTLTLLEACTDQRLRIVQQEAKGPLTMAWRTAGLLWWPGWMPTILHTPIGWKSSGSIWSSTLQWMY